MICWGLGFQDFFLTLSQSDAHFFMTPPCDQVYSVHIPYTIGLIGFVESEESEEVGQLSREFLDQSNRAIFVRILAEIFV